MKHKEQKLEPKKLCPFCKKRKNNVGVICPCEVKPKYDADYEDWKNK